MMLYFKELEKNGNKVSIKPNHKDTENYSTQLFFFLFLTGKKLFSSYQKSFSTFYSSLEKFCMVLYRANHREKPAVYELILSLDI